MQYIQRFRSLAVRSAGLVFLLAGVAAGCSSTALEGEVAFRRSFSFGDGAKDGWEAGFADYPSDLAEVDYGLVFEARELPPELGPGRGLYLAGVNHSDDLFMFLKREIDGLAPNTTYDVRLRVMVASNAPSGCAGAGGAPGESVYLKVGASTREPVVEVKDRFHTLSVDKGDQAGGGRNAVVVGDVANGSPCAVSLNAPYKLLARDNDAQPVTVSSDDDGRLWVFVGTESGFEGTTSLYYTAIEVKVALRGA